MLIRFELVVQKGEELVRITLDVHSSELMESRVGRAAEADGRVQGTDGTSVSIRKICRGAIVPIFLHQSLQGADSTLFLRLLASGMDGAQEIVHCWKVQQTLQQGSAVTNVPWIVQTARFVILEP